MVVQPLNGPKIICIVAAVIRDERVRTLLERKRGATVFQLRRERNLPLP